MFVIQLGAFAWLSDIIPVTTSGRHATRYPTEAEAKAAIAALDADRRPALAHMEPAQRTYYANPAEVPATIVPVAELEARLKLVHGHAREAAPQAGDREAPTAPVAEKPARAPGVTAMIYQWVKDHPEATKADAIAAFPSANRSTVSVQFSAARRGA